ncbi:hypothetical protein SAMN05216338_100582 [Bradyrhizobium sp. Rc2d]|nr:hypothetical protein SAMN05216338_100582 [Bradyrhizobium sp. Rc2d]
MMRKSVSNSGAPNSLTRRSKTAPTPRSATTRDIYMKKISANPKWRDTTKSGQGFVIGGAKASTKTK